MTVIQNGARAHYMLMTDLALNVGLRHGEVSRIRPQTRSERTFRGDHTAGSHSIVYVAALTPPIPYEL